VSRSVATAAALAAVLVAAGCAQEEPAARRLPPGTPLVASASLSPLVAGFGDPVTARVRVLLDPAHVEPASLRLRTDFGSWRERRSVERADAGGLVGVTYTLHLTCLIGPCVSELRQLQYAFREARLGYRAAGEERLLLVAWPELEVSTRLPRSFEPPPDTGEGAAPVWRAAVVVPEPSFRIAPDRLRAALLALGVLLVAGSTAAAAVLLRRPRAPKELPPLERALALLERARTPAERRAALEALAAELHPALAVAARELAWSERTPTEPAARALSERVREVAR